MQSPTGKPFTVTEISTRIRSCLEQTFGTIEVEGEVTDYKGANASGHHYFSLKDANSLIGAVFFRGRYTACGVSFKNGTKLRVTGQISTFASRYQIIVSHIVDVGIGDLAVRFQELKERLAKEGLFDESRKRTLPLLPRHIGLVTSPTGSVIRDFIKVISRRYPNIDLLLAPVKVQGEGCASSVARAIAALNKVGHPGSGFLESLPKREVIIVMRGGGSMEELWGFNEEVVARAIAASAIPVISGVGHQTDFTICDFVADHRSPTPSAAAEELVAPKTDFEANLAHLSEQMQLRLSNSLQNLQSRLVAVAKNHVFSDPIHALQNYIQRVDSLTDALNNVLASRITSTQTRITAATHALTIARTSRLPEIHTRLLSLSTLSLHALTRSLDSHRARLSSAVRQLESLSPLAVLNRGYSITLLENGRALRSPSEAPPGTRITTRLAQNATILSVVPASNTTSNTDVSHNLPPRSHKKVSPKNEDATLPELDLFSLPSSQPPTPPIL